MHLLNCCQCVRLHKESDADHGTGATPVPPWELATEGDIDEETIISAFSPNCNRLPLPTHLLQPTSSMSMEPMAVIDGRSYPYVSNLGLSPSMVSVKPLQPSLGWKDVRAGSIPLPVQQISVEGLSPTLLLWGQSLQPCRQLPPEQETRELVRTMFSPSARPRQPVDPGAKSPVLSPPVAVLGQRPTSLPPMTGLGTPGGSLAPVARSARHAKSPKTRTSSLPPGIAVAQSLAAPSSGHTSPLTGRASVGKPQASIIVQQVTQPLDVRKVQQAQDFLKGLVTAREASVGESVRSPSASPPPMRCSLVVPPAMAAPQPLSLAATSSAPPTPPVPAMQLIAPVATSIAKSGSAWSLASPAERAYLAGVATPPVAGASTEVFAPRVAAAVVSPSPAVPSPRLPT